MDDMRMGSAFRAVRIRRGWRQEDVAARAGVARSLVSELERGHLDSTSLRSRRAVAAALDIKLDVVPHWRGGELYRLLSGRHSALNESVNGYFDRLHGWQTRPELSFSIYGERGVVDLVAYHAASSALIVIELKTAIIDVNELVGTLDRKARLAPRIVEDLGWRVDSVSRWVIVSRDKTNQRRIAAHRSMLRAAFPSDGHAIRSWLARPHGVISALSMWTPVVSTDVGPARSQRIRVPRDRRAHR
jgi:transcriptional regulator with XRE-family HTH domain